MNKYKHEKTIDNIKDLKNFISEVRKDKQLIFRGHKNIEYKIMSTMTRDMMKNKEKINHCNYVSNAINDLKKYKEPINPNFWDLNSWEKYSNRQHNGSRSILIDFSYDVYVALFFASEEMQKDGCDSDGEIFIINSGNERHVKIIENDEIEKIEFEDYLNNKREDDLIDKLHIWEPKKYRPRIESQKSVFLLSGNSILEKSDCRIRVIKITSNFKEELRMFLNDKEKNEHKKTNIDTVYADHDVIRPIAQKYKNNPSSQSGLFLTDLLYGHEIPINVLLKLEYFNEYYNPQNTLINGILLTGHQDTVNFHYKNALELLFNKKWDAALCEFKKIKETPNGFMFYFYMAVVYFKNHKFEECKTNCKNFIKKYSQTGWGLNFEMSPKNEMEECDIKFAGDFLKNISWDLAYMRVVCEYYGQEYENCINIGRQQVDEIMKYMYEGKNIPADEMDERRKLLQSDGLSVNYGKSLYYIYGKSFGAMGMFEDVDNCMTHLIKLSKKEEAAQYKILRMIANKEIYNGNSSGGKGHFLAAARAFTDYHSVYDKNNIEHYNYDYCGKFKDEIDDIEEFLIKNHGDIWPSKINACLKDDIPIYNVGEAWVE